MCWLATDQNDLQAFPEISLGKGVELKQEKIKRPITVLTSNWNLFWQIWNLER